MRQNRRGGERVAFWPRIALIGGLRRAVWLETQILVPILAGRYNQREFVG